MSSPAANAGHRRGRPVTTLYGIGVASVALGSVLPWHFAPQSVVAAWDLGVLWAFTGRLDLLHIPPSVGAVVLVLAVVLAWPLLGRGTTGGAVGASVSGAVIAVAALAIVRGILFEPNSLPPHAGSVVALAGGVMAAVAAMVPSR